MLAILLTVSSRCKSLGSAEPLWSLKPLCALSDLFFDIAETMSEAFAIWQRPESSPFWSEKQDLGLIYLSFSLWSPEKIHIKAETSFTLLALTNSSRIRGLYISCIWHFDSFSLLPGCFIETATTGDTAETMSALPTWCTCRFLPQLLRQQVVKRCNKAFKAKISGKLCM